MVCGIPHREININIFISLWYSLFALCVYPVDLKNGMVGCLQQTSRVALKILSVNLNVVFIKF